MEASPLLTPESSPPLSPPEVITFRRSYFYLALLPLVFVLGLASGYLLWGRRTPVGGGAAAPAAVVGAPEATPGAASQAQAPVPNQATRQTITRYPVPIGDNNPVLGPNDAPITIIEFSDYQCPYCRKWHQETFRPLMQAYPGLIRFAYRDFPLDSIHPQARPAAIAAACAGEQDKYWSYHDLLFSASTLNSEAYAAIASSLDLDMAAFNRCLTAGPAAANVNDDYEYASELGVRSTPTFFVNGIALVGAQPLEVFQQVIDMELAGN